MLSRKFHSQKIEYQLRWADGGIQVFQIAHSDGDLGFMLETVGTSGMLSLGRSGTGMAAVMQRLGEHDADND